MAQPDDKFPTIIGADARFKGELTFEKGVRLLGQFEGQISTKGQLHVAEGARLLADVSAGDIQVEGEVKGNLTATGKVQLKSSARLEGDLRTARLEVMEGAMFVGNCLVGQQAMAKGPARPETAAPARAAASAEKNRPTPEPAKK
ncbi:MAG: polymer-forming cytoskeletal protein [Phycisphaerae bacterium]